MFKKLFGKTKKASSEDQPSEPKAPKPQRGPHHGPHKATAPSPRLLTAEGWKRLMMKKYRKTS